MKVAFPLLLVLCSCPSVRVPGGYVIEPSVGIEYWDSGDTTLGDDFYVGKFWLNLRADDKPRPEVPAHPGFLDRYESDLARAEAEESAVASASEAAAALVPVDDADWIEQAERAGKVAEGLSGWTIAKICALFVVLGGLGTLLWHYKTGRGLFKD
ncbi:MAG TPA: hypothetical protein VM537_14400 [Anaerolineae bacterium]|nr:hypothetical protein [Anaerolineae bacterium]